MRALDIEVPDDLRGRWVEWFAPDVQPFVVDPVLAESVGSLPDDRDLPAERVLKEYIEAFGPWPIACCPERRAWRARSRLVEGRTVSGR